jgi:DNA-binding transcriptional LysR family regulator
MDWDDVRVFVEVARAKTLAAGASAAGLDRSTASRRIAALERSLGARLFLRTRDGLRLSPAGERLIVHADRVAEGVRALRRAADRESDEVTGVVRIATTEALATMLVHQGLVALGARHPRLELELLGDNRVVDLSRGEADLAVRLTKVEEPSLLVKRIARLPFALYASEDYLARRGRPTSEKELAGHDAITFGGRLAALPEAVWVAAHPELTTVLRTTSMTAVLAAASAGFGVAVAAGAWAEGVPGLVRVLPLPSIPPRPVWLVVHPDAATRPAVRVVSAEIELIAKRGETV